MMSRQEVASEALRLVTIQVLGALAVVTGLLVVFTAPRGTSSLSLFDNHWWWPEVAGYVLVTAGALQLLSTWLGWTTLTIYSCFVSTLWYAWLGSLLLWTWVLWAVHGYLGRGPSLYPMAVSWGLGVLTLLNGLGARTKARIGDEER